MKSGKFGSKKSTDKPRNNLDYLPKFPLNKSYYNVTMVKC